MAAFDFDPIEDEPDLIVPDIGTEFDFHCHDEPPYGSRQSSIVRPGIQAK